MTTYAERIVTAAATAGLNPRVANGDPRARTTWIVLGEGTGVNGTFGHVVVGPSGRVIRATLHNGNNDTKGTKYKGAIATYRALRDLAEKKKAADKLAALLTASLTAA